MKKINGVRRLNNEKKWSISFIPIEESKIIVKATGKYMPDLVILAYEQDVNNTAEYFDEIFKEWKIMSPEEFIKRHNIAVSAKEINYINGNFRQTKKGYKIFDLTTIDKPHRLYVCYWGGSFNPTTGDIDVSKERVLFYKNKASGGRGCGISYIIIENDAYLNRKLHEVLPYRFYSKQTEEGELENIKLENNTFASRLNGKYLPYLTVVYEKETKSFYDLPWKEINPSLGFPDGRSYMMLKGKLLSIDNPYDYEIYAFDTTQTGDLLIKVSWGGSFNDTRGIFPDEVPFEIKFHMRRSSNSGGFGITYFVIPDNNA